MAPKKSAALPAYKPHEEEKNIPQRTPQIEYGVRPPGSRPVFWNFLPLTAQSATLNAA